MLKDSGEALQPFAMSYKLQRSERLRGTKIITALFDKGRGGFTHPIKYVFETLTNDAPSQVNASILVSVPKRNHKRANKRNLLKRKIREAYRLNKGALDTACQERGKTIRIAFIYSSKEVEDFKTIQHAVRIIIDKVAKGL